MRKILLFIFSILLISLVSATTTNTESIIKTYQVSAPTSSASDFYGFSFYVNQTMTLKQMGMLTPPNGFGLVKLTYDNGSLIYSASVSNNVSTFNDTSLTKLYAGTKYRLEVQEIGTSVLYENITNLPIINNATIILNGSLNGADTSGTTIYFFKNITYDLDETNSSQNGLTKCYQNSQNIYLKINTKNETTSLDNIASSIILTFNYSINNGTYRTYTYSSSDENYNYFFCYNSSNDNLTLYPSIAYYNSYSVQRNYATGTTLTSSGKNITLYLLPTILGNFARFITQTTGGGILSNVMVSVTRSLGGSDVIIYSGLTDSAGLVPIWLSPYNSYSFSFSKSGYVTNSFSTTPNSITDYTVYMQSNTGTGFIQNGSTITQNLNITINPINITLINQTIYNFNISVLGNISSVSINVTNISNYQLGYSNTSSYSSVNVNTGNNQYILVTYNIRTPTESYSFSRTYLVSDIYIGDYSLFRVMSSWSLYGFAYDYYKIIIILAVLIMAIGGLSKIEVIDTHESKIGLGLSIIWIFSYVGWLTLGIANISPNSPFYILNHAANQYGIAIISTIGGVYLLRDYFT